MSNDLATRVPNKALNSEQGRIISFDSQSIHSPNKSGLFALIAREIMHTKIAAEEAAWPSSPAVLVITDVKSASREVKVFERKLTHPSEPTTKSPKVELKNRVYGSSLPAQEGIIRETDFLSDILVETNTGLNLYEFPSTAPVQTKKALLRWARKYFDFILVEHKLVRSIHEDNPDYFLLAPRVVDGKVLYPVAAKDSKNIDICETAYGLTRSKYSLRIPSYSVKRPGSINVEGVNGGNVGSKEIPPAYFDTEVTRLMISDIVRDILGVNHVAELELKKNKSSVTSPRHSSWYLSIRRKLVISFVLTAVIITFLSGFFSGFTADSLPSPFPIMTVLGIILLVVTDRMSKDAVESISSNKAYDELISVANRLVPEMSKPLELTKEVPNSGIQEGISVTGQLIEIDMVTNSIRASDSDQVALESYLSTERSPLEIAHKKSDSLLSRWADYELDPIKFLEFPLLSDSSDPDVSSFHVAMNDMKRYRSMLEQDPTLADEFADAVVEAERRFLIAEGKAKKLRSSYLNEEGQEKLRKAHPFVSLMADDGASLNERTVAYEQASKILAGVIALPDETIKGLLSSSTNRTDKEKSA